MDRSCTRTQEQQRQSPAVIRDGPAKQSFLVSCRSLCNSIQEHSCIECCSFGILMTSGIGSKRSGCRQLHSEAATASSKLPFHIFEVVICSSSFSPRVRLLPYISGSLYLRQLSDFFGFLTHRFLRFCPPKDEQPDRRDRCQGHLITSSSLVTSLTMSKSFFPEEEGDKDGKFWTKFKENPTFPIGIAAFTGVVIYGLAGLRTRKIPMSMYLIQLRVASQGLCIGILALGMAYQLGQKIYSRIGDKPVVPDLDR